VAWQNPFSKKNNFFIQALTKSGVGNGICNVLSVLSLHFKISLKQQHPSFTSKLWYGSNQFGFFCVDQKP
jgi:hypothetical protein